MKKIIIYCSLLIISLLAVIGVSAFEVRVKGDRFSLNVRKVPLQGILKHLADQGIKIRIEPQLNPKITASFEDREIRKGLDSILKSLNYVLIWRSIEGPLGPMTILNEIQVFRPGKKRRIRILDKASGNIIARDPRDGSFFVKNEVLVRLRKGVSIADFQELLIKISGRVVDSNAAVGIYKVRLPKGSDVSSLVDIITNNPVISKAEPNYAYLISKPYRESAHSISPGSDSSLTFPPESKVPIAILDTGFDQDSGIEGYILTSLDAINPDTPISDPLGHGTQMAFIAAGVIKPYGVQVDVDTYSPIIPIRVVDENGFISNFDIMRSIDFALKNGARVMSLSWGSETKSQFLEEDLFYAYSKGLIAVASAGNDPTGNPVYPAAYDTVIGVGALDPDGKSWERSNFGDFVSIYAPGFAPLPVGYKGDPGTYAGTSISAAFLANLIANYISHNSNVNIGELIRKMGRK